MERVPFRVVGRGSVERECSRIFVFPVGAGEVVVAGAPLARGAKGVLRLTGPVASGGATGGAVAVSAVSRVRMASYFYGSKLRDMCLSEISFFNKIKATYTSKSYDGWSQERHNKFGMHLTDSRVRPSS